MSFRFIFGTSMIPLAWFATDLHAYAQELSFLHSLPNPSAVETSTAITADETGVYVAGLTRPASGNTYGFNSDAFVRKYDFTGVQIWERTFGGPVIPAALVASNGAIYVEGSTAWNFAAQVYYVLPGQRGNGLSDVFVRRYDQDGNEVWTRQFGNENGDAGNGITADSTGVYVLGFFGALYGPGQAFLRKYGVDGNEIWTQKLDGASSVAADGTGVAVAEPIPPPVAGSQWTGTISRYDRDGSLLWKQSLDPGWFPQRVAAENGNVYVSGWSGLSETFLRKFDKLGGSEWVHRFPAFPANSIAMDVSGVYLAGATTQTLPGQCSSGGDDAVVKAVGFDGTELWTRQFGSYYSDTANQIAASGGAFYVVGTQNSAEYYPTVQRTYLAKLTPESATVSTPRIRAECVLNAANYFGGAVAPGEIVTILGSKLGPTSAISFAGKDGAVPSSLGGVRVLFNDIAAPVLSASDSQITAVVPFAIADQASVDVHAEYNGIRSQRIAIPVLPSRPGVFSQDGSGVGPAAAVNQDGTINSKSNPAPRGSLVSLYVTGLGLTDPALPDGEIVGGAIPKVKGPVSVILTNDGYIEDGIGADGVYYAGEVAGFVHGFSQVNIQIPTGNYFASGAWAPQVFLGEAWTSPVVALNSSVIWIE